MYSLINNLKAIKLKSSLVGYLESRVDSGRIELGVQVLTLMT